MLRRSPLRRRSGLRAVSPRRAAQADEINRTRDPRPLDEAIVDAMHPRWPAIARKAAMRRISKKRSAETKEYRIRRGAFLTERVWCEFPGCGRRSQDVHHKRGRVGWRYLAVEHWAALCRTHHDWVTVNPAEAIRLGLSESRLT